jgi:hypothetical protein
MPVPTIPMTMDELERMRQILYKSETEKIPLTYEEEGELRRLVAKGKPDEAQNADLAFLIFLGLALLGLYVTILRLDKPRKAEV